MGRVAYQTAGLLALVALTACSGVTDKAGTMALKAIAAHLEPYADGTRTTIVRIEPTFVSGRRIVHQ